MSDRDSLGDRMKRYEHAARHSLTPRVPVIVRVDGRAFHSYTRGMDRPFDERLAEAMLSAAIGVAKEMQGFRLGYIQSDEASFLLEDFETIHTQPWFGYVQSKVETIAASTMTAHFNEQMRGRTEKLAMFDARAFNVPEGDAANYFLWRAKDWERNSVAMYCGAHFSHKQMHGQGRADQHEILHSIGKNWATDLKPWQRNGVFLLRSDSGVSRLPTVTPTYAEISALLQREAGDE